MASDGLQRAGELLGRAGRLGWEEDAWVASSVLQGTRCMRGDGMVCC
jgi:hypothetical protein